MLGDFFESVKKDYVNAAAMYKSNCDDQDFYHSCFKFSKYNVSGRGNLAILQHILFIIVASGVLYRQCFM